MLGYKKNLLRMAVLFVLASAFWVLKVEITYQRNVRHIPTDFRERHRPPTYLWRA